MIFPLGAKRLEEALGNDDQANYMLKCVLRATPYDNPDTLINSFIQTLHELKPRNNLERMLVLQMFLANDFSVNALRLANKCVLTEDKNFQASIAMRMMRLYLAQMEALRKNRNAGRQHITVNHVYTQNAIVGDVTTRG